MLWLTRKMTTRACVWKSGSLAIELATFPLAASQFLLNLSSLSEAKDLLSTAPLLFKHGIALRWTCRSTLVPNFKPKTNRGHNEAEQDSGVAGRNCRRSSVDCMGLLCWEATGSALRGHAEARIIPEGTALSAFHAHLDCADICDVDSHRASLCVGSRHRRPGTENGSQNRSEERRV